MNLVEEKNGLLEGRLIGDHARIVKDANLVAHGLYPSPLLPRYQTRVEETTLVWYILIIYTRTDASYVQN